MRWMISWIDTCVQTTIVNFSEIVSNLEINKKRSRQEEVPNFIDLEGNEEHISKVKSQWINSAYNIEIWKYARSHDET